MGTYFFSGIHPPFGLINHRDVGTKSLAELGFHISIRNQEVSDYDKNSLPTM